MEERREQFECSTALNAVTAVKNSTSAKMQRHTSRIALRGHDIVIP
jgi:hypothetical protein